MYVYVYIAIHVTITCHVIFIMIVFSEYFVQLTDPSNKHILHYYQPHHTSAPYVFVTLLYPPHLINPDLPKYPLTFYRLHVVIICVTGSVFKLKQVRLASIILDVQFAIISTNLRRKCYY